MNQYKAVIFDVGGVLHSSDIGWQQDVIDELGLSADQFKQFHQNHITRLGSGQINEETLWADVQQEFGMRPVRVDEDLLGRSLRQNLKPHHEVERLAKCLREAGYMTPILSDTIEAHASFLRNSGTYDGFEPVFLSHEIGRRKSEASTFQFVLDELGLRPEQAIMVDDREDNIARARALGVHGIVFTDADALRQELAELLPDVDFDAVK